MLIVWYLLDAGTGIELATSWQPRKCTYCRIGCAAPMNSLEASYETNSHALTL